MTRYEIIPLVLSNIEVEKSKMTYLANCGIKMLLPVVSFYLRGGDKNILVDTGSSAETMFRYEPNQSAKDVISIEDALGRQGLMTEDVDIVIQTHLHHDHIGNTARFPKARVVVQEAELNFALAPHPLFAAVYPLELLKGVRLYTVRGDTEIADGVKVLLTPGHSPGTQSVAVETTKGTAIITGFCCIGETFVVSEETARLAPRWLVYSPGCHTDALAAFDNALMVKGLADILIPNHEPTLREVAAIP